MDLETNRSHQPMLLNKRRRSSLFVNQPTLRTRKKSGSSRMPILISGLQRYVYQAAPRLGTVSVNLEHPSSSLKTASICYTDHFGVVRAFLDAGQLPRVISGTSAGGVVAALVCTRTDEELKQLLVPELANRISACEEPFNVWFKRFWATGARFDSVAWARKVNHSTSDSRQRFSCANIVFIYCPGHILHARVYDF